MSKKTPFQPNYDPLYHKTPGCNREYAPSYWVENAGQPPADDGALKNDIEADVAIIGAGFTGLATAMFLAKEYNIKAHVLEANQVGWGCTSRNGGQGHLAWGRLSRTQWAKKWGIQVAKEIHQNTLKGFDVFLSLTQDNDIDCDPYGDGNILVAHSNYSIAGLKKESEFCNNILNYKTKFVNRAYVHENYMRDEESKGALIEPVGIALQPLKLAFSYMKIARKHGAKVHPSSPVTNWRTENNKHYLTTPSATLKTKVVVVATAGYTHHTLHPLLAYKNMPIMANSAVTGILTEQQIASCGFKSNLIMTDSRKLRFYYRYLPEKRLQIGTRSAITGSDNDNPKHLKIVKAAITAKFPALKNVNIDYFWSGWMDISHDMIPRVIQPDKKQKVYYAQGYSGNGVSFSAYAALNLAKLVIGKKIEDSNLPIFSSPLPSHPLRILRRSGQKLMFNYFNWLDKKP